MTGGSKINPRKTITAARYMAYFNAFFDDSAFRTSEILRRYSKTHSNFTTCFLINSTLFFVALKVSSLFPFEPHRLTIRTFLTLCIHHKYFSHYYIARRLEKVKNENLYVAAFKALFCYMTYIKNNRNNGNVFGAFVFCLLEVEFKAYWHIFAP